MPNEVVGFKINGSTYKYDHEELANLPDIDATPTANSTNAVQSGGVKSALDGIQAEIPTVDAIPTQGSTNAVRSGGVYSALDTLQAQIPQIDATLTQSGQAADAAAVGAIARVFLALGLRAGEDGRIIQRLPADG